MPETTYDTLTTEQLRALLDIGQGKNVSYVMWEELHLLGLADISFTEDDESPLQDVLTDEGLIILGGLK